ncbi:MAG: nucleotidyltransferase family protein [Bacteroidales bacterium]|nr:nucleotidyltransferase family protein [Bacteroidales bacterium]
MKAIIFAAGLGSRLRPLTDHTPKALLKINGKPLLAHAIEKLQQAGVTEIIVNVHHLAEQVVFWLENNHYQGITFSISDERDALLDTGGGLKKAAAFFNDGEPFFAYNADIITDLDLSAMMDFHRKHHALATLALSERTTARYLLFDDAMRLKGWTNVKTGETIPQSIDTEHLRQMAFSGIHIINPSLLHLLDKDGNFPIIPEYLRLCTEHAIIGYDHTGRYWMDMGKPEGGAR